jgi:hypothetical protein
VGGGVRRRDVRRLALLAAATALPLAVALLPPVLNDWFMFTAKAGVDSVTLESAWRTLLMLAGTAHPLLAVAVVGCAVVGARSLRRRDPFLAWYMFAVTAGGTLAVVADHYAERRGVTVTFLGLPTTAVRTVGVLACRYNAGIVVAGIRRLGEAFRFEIDVADVIVPADWAGETDAVAYITRRYVQALERLVLRDPTQYPWLHARWGEELAQRLTETAEAG